MPDDDASPFEPVEFIGAPARRLVIEWRARERAKDMMGVPLRGGNCFGGEASDVVRDVKRQPKKRRPAWRDAATYAVEKISSKSLLRCRYGGDVGLDAAAAIAALDTELARLGIRYEARYLGVRDGRATFRITARYTVYNNAMFDAVRRVGILS